MWRVGQWAARYSSARAVKLVGIGQIMGTMRENLEMQLKRIFIIASTLHQHHRAVYWGCHLVSSVIYFPSDSSRGWRWFGISYFCLSACGPAGHLPWEGSFLGAALPEIWGLNASVCRFIAQAADMAFPPALFKSFGVSVKKHLLLVCVTNASRTLTFLQHASLVSTQGAFIDYRQDKRAAFRRFSYKRFQLWTHRDTAAKNPGNEEDVLFATERVNVFRYTTESSWWQRIITKLLQLKSQNKAGKQSTPHYGEHSAYCWRCDAMGVFLDTGLH